uniref:Uncharacterized protein n=1 Tax=Arundo donax TaxID=35708 RepID=A0A0A9GCM4_ARUDO
MLLLSSAAAAAVATQLGSNGDAAFFPPVFVRSSGHLLTGFLIMPHRCMAALLLLFQFVIGAGHRAS